MTCEGLSEWRGQSAWVVHFRHRPDRHNYFFLYVTPQGEFEIKLKGRAWIATKTGDVLEMETDLVEAVPDALLTRSHLNVEYGPVSFASTEDFLWLPVRAELFSEVKNRRSRIRHTFRDFHIFSVTTDQKITVPEPKNPLK
jgi:hypothetical protein